MGNHVIKWSQTSGAVCVGKAICCGKRVLDYEINCFDKVYLFEVDV